VTGDSQAVLAVAERAVALASAAGASEAEALVSDERAQLTRFANSEIHQNVAETNGTTNLSVSNGKRVGVAS
jgi:predicted Zn-dependent protease